MLESVRARGHLICGTGQNETGFAALSGPSQWRGLYIDLCRGIAAAALGDSEAVKFIPLAGAARFQAVRDREIDVLARATAWTLQRDAQKALSFVTAYYHGGKGFMIARSSGVTSALELSGATVCLVAGGLTEASVRGFFSRRGMKFMTSVSETWSDAMKRYLDGQCIVLAADISQLAIERSKLDEPEQHILLPEAFGFDVFGPVVRAGDPELVRDRALGDIRAHSRRRARCHLGFGRGCCEEGPIPDVKQFFAAAASASSFLGLDEKWLEKLIGQVGNYAEIYERHLGEKSGVDLPRGRNALVGNGGAFAAPAFR